jgi:hypothetical protein
MWLIGVALVLGAAYFSLTIAGPLVFCVMVAVAAGIVLFEFATAAAFVFRGASAPITHLRIEPEAPAPDDPHPPEPAYRSYYLGPVFLDYALAARTAAAAAWERSFAGRAPGARPGATGMRSISQQLVDRYTNLGMYVPINPTAAKAIAFGPFVGALLGLAAGVAAGAALGLAISAVFGAAVVLTVVGAVVVAVVMRVLEIGLLRLRSITLECPACHRKATAPTYLCPHCPPTQRALHRRLVPSRYGVLFRICRCGSRLPTLLAGKKYRLEAFCQHCRAPLPADGLTAPTLHIPVVAGRQAGKTVFMTAAVAGLEQRALADNGAAGFTFADAASLPAYTRARDALRHASFAQIAATVAVASAPAFNIYLGTGRRRRLMYLYDAAGERFEQESGIDTLRYLEHAGGVVVIVDPFSFSDVRRSTEPDILDAVRHSLVDVDEVVSRFAEGLRRTAGARAGRRLDIRAAVVLTKCDALLRSSVVAHPFDELDAAATDSAMLAERSAAIQRWLTETAGHAGLLRVVSNTFSQSEYFAVSAADAFDNAERPSGRTQQLVRNDDPATPLQWLLTRRSRS